PMTPSSPLVRRDAIRFVFVGTGSSVPSGGPAPDRLCLDVGNDLRVGVIDHHQLQAYEGSTTRLVASNPDPLARPPHPPPAGPPRPARTPAPPLPDRAPRAAPLPLGGPALSPRRDARRRRIPAGHRGTRPLCRQDRRGLDRPYPGSPVLALRGLHAVAPPPR